MTGARVGFQFRGRDYTPAEPCTFGDFCRIDDFENWLRHTQQWMFAVLNRAKTSSQLIAMRPTVHRLSSLEATGRRSIVDRFKLTGPTRALVDMAVDLANVANTLGPPVSGREVTIDLSPPMVRLPIPADVKATLGWDWSFDKFVGDLARAAKKAVGSAWLDKNLGWLMLGGLALLAYSDVRRRVDAY